MTAAIEEVPAAEATVRTTVGGQCSEQTARDYTKQIRGLFETASRSLETASNLIKEAYTRRVWVALGFRAWEDYCDQEFGSAVARSDRVLRREAVAKLTTGKNPMSNRAAASVLGVDEGTVRNDRKVAGAEDSAPEPHPDVVDAEIVEEPEPRKVIGSDGKSYPTKPESQRRRRPLPDAFFHAARDLDKAAQRLVRLTEDDRFPTHTANLGGRGDIQRAADAIRTVLDALAEAENVG